MDLPMLSGGSFIEQIRNWKNLWNSRLRDEFRRREIVAGPGVRVSRTPRGTVVSVNRGHGGTPPAGSGEGPFTVSLEDNLFKVTGGWLNRNGLEMIELPPSQLQPRAGYVCVCSEPVDKKGNWSEPNIRILEKPLSCAFPVAHVAQSGTGWEIEQYPVAVAIILAAKRCPVAEL